MFKNIPNYPVKQGGKEFWVSRSVVVISMIIHQDKVLITRRGDAVTHTGLWCMPCGYLDWNEVVEDAAIRETYEETGIDLRKYDHGGIIMTELFSGFDTLKQDVSVHYRVDMNEIPPIDMSVIDKSEVIDVQWVNWESVRDMEFAFGHGDRILKYFESV